MEGRAPQPDAPLAAGTRFGTYRIERLIGSGGMGSVYEALHVGLKKRVAIKILHSAFATNAEVVARFLREGEATARINHPNVVDVTDLGVKDGVPYLVMELLIGESLASVIHREKVLPVDRAVDVLLPMISAVGMAHDEGVVHRDLKPDNIFLAKNRLGTVEPKLLDFGISKMVTRSELTTAASVLGTPHYLSPEQAQALKDIDGRADQYSLAVILYRLITGALPVGGGDVVLDVLIAVAQGRVRPPRAVRPDLPEQLERVIMRGLATQAKDRYPHTHLMGFDLLPFASDEGRAMWRGHFVLRLAELGGDVKTQVMNIPAAAALPVAAPGRSSASAAAQRLGVPVMPPGMTSTAPPPGMYGGPVSSGPPPSPGSPPGSMPPFVSSAPPAMGVVPSVTPARITAPPVIVRSPASSAPPGVRPTAGGTSLPTEPIGTVVGPPARPRHLSDVELTEANAADPLAREHFGTRISAGVLAGALVLAALAIGGALWWSSSKERPVAIPTGGERPVATYRVRVAFEPASAEVILDGSARAPGPLDIELAADGQEHALEVRAPGYVSETIRFRQGSVPPDVVRLQKSP